LLATLFTEEIYPEDVMKLYRMTIILLAFAVIVTAQTEHVGQHVYYNSEGGINMALDAGLAVQRLDSPYVGFALMVGGDEGVNATINRKDVIMVYNGQEYHMPDIKTFRSEYRFDIRDQRYYDSFAGGIESLIGSYMRLYEFQWDRDFFPSRSSGKLVAEEISLSPHIAMVTAIYFKNPGFKVGDTLVIKVTDKSNPNISGSCTVELKEVKKR
jgi:hypothetical protein